MCTERTPDAIVVCDVAITHLPYEGNLVTNPDTANRDQFRAALAGAIAQHGGSLA